MPTAALTSATQEGDSAKMDTSDDADGSNSITSTHAKSLPLAASDKSSPQSPDSDEKKLFDSSASSPHSPAVVVSGEANNNASSNGNGEPNSKRRKCV